ncbi:VanZ family protein [Sphaerisporangium sp. NPDC051011]|uniref:VanZ family protein n=1 Tax=Sphaerisporangium sp. NPDC051011 TaxID=3155792 RepID=UPI0033DE52CE
MLKGTVLVLALPVIIIFLMVWNKKTRPSKFRLLGGIALAVYVLLLLDVTLFPLPVQSEVLRDRRLYGSPPNNLIPLKGLIGMMEHQSSAVLIRQIVGNILLFLPLGYLVPAIWKVRGVHRLAFIAFSVSLLIEGAQFLISQAIGYTYRIFDVDDLILNTLGGIIGYVIYAAFVPVIRAFEMDVVQHAKPSDGRSASSSANP